MKKISGLIRFSVSLHVCVCVCTQRYILKYIKYKSIKHKPKFIRTPIFKYLPTYLSLQKAVEGNISLFSCCPLVAYQNPHETTFQRERKIGPRLEKTCFFWVARLCI